jgi:uncharacterized protein (DUF433 family)
MKPNKRREMGKYVVADPEVCHGQLTVKGTRILIKDLLYYVAEGKDWDWICSAFDQKVSHDVIAEAVRLAGDALLGGSPTGRTARRQRAA